MAKSHVIGLRPIALVLVWLLAVEGLAPARAGQAAGQTAGVDASGLTLVVVEGEGAINNVQQRLARAPVVRVEDGTGKPVPKATVVFLLPDSGPGGMFLDKSNMLTIPTGEDGVAIGRGLRPNNVVGQFQIRVLASYRGQTASTLINQTNVAPAVASGGGSGKIIAIVAVLAGAAAGGVFAFRSRSDKGSPAAPEGTVLTPGTPIFGPPR